VQIHHRVGSDLIPIEKQPVPFPDPLEGALIAVIRSECFPFQIVLAHEIQHIRRGLPIVRCVMGAKPSRNLSRGNPPFEIFGFYLQEHRVVLDHRVALLRHSDPFGSDHDGTKDRLKAVARLNDVRFARCSSLKRAGIDRQLSIQSRDLIATVSQKSNKLDQIAWGFSPGASCIPSIR